MYSRNSLPPGNSLFLLKIIADPFISFWGLKYVASTLTCSVRVERLSWFTGHFMITWLLYRTMRSPQFSTLQESRYQLLVCAFQPELFMDLSAMWPLPWLFPAFRKWSRSPCKILQTCLQCTCICAWNCTCNFSSASFHGEDANLLGTKRLGCCCCCSSFHGEDASTISSLPWLFDSDLRRKLQAASKILQTSLLYCIIMADHIKNRTSNFV
jgi:hypothetical protein